MNELPVEYAVIFNAKKKPWKPKASKSYLRVVLPGIQQVNGISSTHNRKFYREIAYDTAHIKA